MMETKACGVRGGALSLLGLAMVGLALGCNQSEAAPQAARPESTPPNAAPAAAASRVDNEHYTIDVKPTAECQLGKECTVEVKLVTRGEYKINKQYPMKFKATEPAPEGVTFMKPLLKREDGKWDDDPKSGSFRVPFVAAKAGKVKVGGVMSLSVCSDANCVMEKQALEVEVDVKE